MSNYEIIKIKKLFKVLYFFLFCLLAFFISSFFSQKINNSPLFIKAKIAVAQPNQTAKKISKKVTRLFSGVGESLEKIAVKTGSLNKINDLSFKPIKININFQKSPNKVLLDYLPDHGQLYGSRNNGLSYGWDQDISKTTRKRKSNNSPDDRFDTLVHMQLAKPKVNAIWEIELPNGDYKLRLIVGDPSYAGGYYQVMAEDIMVIDGAPKSSQRWFDKTVDIKITDGRLTLSNGPKGISNKLAFLEIWQESDQQDKQPPSDVIEQAIIADEESVLLFWDYSLFDVKGVLVVMSQGTEDIFPISGINYSTEDIIGNSQVIYNGRDRQFFVNNLQKGSRYLFKLFAYDENYNYSPGISINMLLKKINARVAKDISVTMLEKLQQGASAETIDYIYGKFAQHHFGAELDPLIYQYYGRELTQLKNGDWAHISQNSASLAWQTNLPATSYVEYGETTRYSFNTMSSKRFYSLHLHYLTDLKADTSYQYRLVSMDERGNRIVSENRVFRTDKHSDDVIYIPGKDQKIPYILDKEGATYLLTKDVTAFTTAFIIKAGNITLDLGGHTVTHARAPIKVKNNKLKHAGMGIYGHNQSKSKGLKIINGHIRQGKIKNSSSGAKGGLNSIYLSGFKDVEVAGITIDYHTAQTFGMIFRRVRGQYDIHHNVFIDKGWEISNRHGSGGSRPLYFENLLKGVNSFTVHHNLVKRTRQNGFSKAQKIFNNEIYVDSWSTNAFAIQPNSIPDTAAGKITDNRIFLTGYHAIGISWAHLDLDVSGNLIHMQGINSARNRWYESFGDQNSLNGFRLTNYGKGGQVRDNLVYDNNLIIGTARNGSQMRGTELFSDYSVSNVVVSDSVIKIEVKDDENSKVVASVVTQGTKRSDSPPVLYKDNELSSNINVIRFGDYYGRGYNHRFERCKLIRTGNYSDFYTFIFDGGYSRDGHVLLDTEFGEGTAYDDVFWKRTGDLSSYSVQWTLTINAKANVPVIITDKEGNEVFNGMIDNTGRLDIPLTQVVIRPVEWTPDSTGKGVRRKSEHQKIFKTPHKVIINGDNKQIIDVNMDQKRSIHYQKDK